MPPFRSTSCPIAKPSVFQLPLDRVIVVAVVVRLPVKAGPMSLMSSPPMRAAAIVPAPPETGRPPPLSVIVLPLIDSTVRTPSSPVIDTSCPTRSDETEPNVGLETVTVSAPNDSVPVTR